MTHRLRMTQQRQVILEELRKVTTHPTADEICQVVRQQMPHISLATVYRNLDILAANGLIQKLELAGHQKRFDGDAEEHLHVRCHSCGRIADLPAKPIDVPLEEIQQVTDFKITGHRVEFLGLCPECSKADKSESATARRA